MKEKIKLALAKLSGINLAHTLVLLLVIKAIIFDVTPATVALTVPVLAYEAYNLWLKSKKPDPIVLNEEVRKELELVKTKLNAVTMDKNVKPEKVRYF